MYEKLMDEVVTDENRQLALKAVKRNQGAAGIDHMKTTELESHLQGTGNGFGRSCWRGLTLRAR